ncbi:MAG: pyridoxal-phosphate dependent enzyme, partial [Candidatus Bathyarchaeia archaeon]
ISAIWKGFRELYTMGLVDRLPQMVGIQAEGAAPIANLIKRGFGDIEFVNRPETIATAIRIGSPVNWKKAVKAIKESGGIAETVSDDEILEAQRLLAQREGIFVEPSGAVPIAGLKKLMREALIDRDELIVCIATGHGLKDPDIILRLFPKPVEAEADIKALVEILSLRA